MTGNILRTANDLSDIVNRISVQSVVALAVLFILTMAMVIIALAAIVRCRKREAELAAAERANESQRNFSARSAMTRAPR